MSDIVAIGEPLFEFAHVPGTDHYQQGFGGDTSNFACAAARAGARVAYLTRLGDDEFGRQFVELWRREGVDCSGVEVDPDAPTGAYFITQGSGGHTFTYRRAGSAASRMHLTEGFRAVLGRARYLHVSGISQAIGTSACDTVFDAIDYVRAGGGRVSFDLNFRPRLWPAARARAIALATLAHTDLFLPSLDEAEALFGIDEPRALIEWAHARGARQVAVKRGALGAMVSDGATIVEVPGLPVEVVDATGAGDCFAGVLVARLAAEEPLAQAARAACIAAALSTTGRGAVAPLPRWSQIAALLREAGGGTSASR
jgi:2-dehydro-3-deoxygluconokinase